MPSFIENTVQTQALRTALTIAFGRALQLISKVGRCNLIGEIQRLPILACDGGRRKDQSWDAQSNGEGCKPKETNSKRTQAEVSYARSGLISRSFR